MHSDKVIALTMTLGLVSHEFQCCQLRFAVFARILQIHLDIHFLEIKVGMGFRVVRRVTTYPPFKDT